VKRGLVVLDPAEVAEDEWRGRVATVQEKLAAEGIDVALVYGDVSRSDDIAYLTNLCIYWNEGVLAVPVAGAPAFLTKLSPRVYPWMRRVSTVTEIRSGRSFADLVAAHLADREPGTLGLVDADLWPSVVADQVAAAVPGWRVRRLGGLVRELRVVPSTAETALLSQGGRAMATAATAATEPGLTVPDRVAAVERTLRGAGFLDVFVHPTTTGDGVVSVRATGQYRTGWLQAGWLADTGNATWPTGLRAALAAALGAVAPGATGHDLATAAASALATLPAGADATVTWVHQADLATGGDYRPKAADLPLPAGAVVAVAVDVLFADGGYAAVAETVAIGDDGVRPLTDGRPTT
jgi:Xaa-Pro aminopeptidase